ncbi:MAG: anti-sigma F factor [Oscillospiraceae bacterium]
MGKIINSFKLTFPSRSCNEAFARTAVASFVTYLDPTLDEVSDIKTSVSEAVTNCTVHAYRDKIGLITIKATLLEDRTVVIQIKDSGCGIGDIKQARTATYSSSCDGERAGLGFSVMEAFMDKVRVRSVVGKGTTVVLSKKIGDKQEA